MIYVSKKYLNFDSSTVMKKWRPLEFFSVFGLIAITMDHNRVAHVKIGKVIQLKHTCN
jgi:hypothetical protein